MHRRTFLKYSAAMTSATALPFVTFTQAAPRKKYANDIITLGNTGIKASRLAMGTGTHGVNRRSNQTEKLGIKGVADFFTRLMIWALTFGIRRISTAHIRISKRR